LVLIQIIAHTNDCKRQLVGKKERKKKEIKNRKEKHRSTDWGLMLWFADLMPDCWLEVSLHPEGPANA
jgi:hypothetical protein